MKLTQYKVNLILIDSLDPPDQNESMRKRVKDVRLKSNAKTANIIRDNHPSTEAKNEAGNEKDYLKTVILYM